MPAMRPLPYSTLARVFELDGWTCDHTSGDHLVYVKPGFRRPVIIPKWREVPTFIIQNNLRMLESAASYFELLARV